MVGEMALEALLVGRQPEEPVALGQPLERDVGMVRADGAARRLEDVGRVAEALVRAVPALVRAEVDVALRMRATDHLLRGPDVVRVGRADEPVRRDRQGVLGRLEQGDLLVDELARRAGFVDGGLGDVDRVLVGAGQEPRVVAEHPVPAGDRVGADHLVQGVQARLVVGVRDRRGQVVARSVGHGRRMVAGRPSRPAPVTVRPMLEHDAATRRSIAVIGAGYVGLVSAVGLAAKGHRDRAGRDRPDPPRRPPRGARPVHRAWCPGGAQRGARLRRPDGPRPRLEDDAPRSCLICVGTPIDDSGHADVGAVEAVLAEIAGLERRPVVVVRSTMPVGTSQRLLRDGHVRDVARFFTVPEFLRQGSALADFAKPTRVVIGRARRRGSGGRGRPGRGLRGVRRAAPAGHPRGGRADQERRERIPRAQDLVRQRDGRPGRAVRGRRRAGARGDRARPADRHRPISAPSFGFGGSCLPKELQTIAMSGIERGLEMHVTSAAHLANLAHQDRFAERIDEIVGGVAGRRIGLLGLAFKAGTDDIRSVAGGPPRRLAARARRRCPRLRPGGGRTRGPGIADPGHGRDRRSRR